MPTHLSRKILTGSLCLTASLITSTCLAQAETPVPVCPTDTGKPYPEFSKPGSNPGVAAWHDLHSLPADCQITIQTPVALTVALAASFKHTGPVDDIAARLGAISAMQDLTYWSVTDNSWRSMVSEAFALKSNNVKTKRSNFSVSEVLSGQTMYFAQNDTRSWGLNIYAFRTISSSPNRLVFLSENSSPIKLGPLTLFAPHDAQNALILAKLDDTTWSYYSFSVVKHSRLGINEKSLINRQAAFYRHLTRQAMEQEPPLAP